MCIFIEKRFISGTVLLVGWNSNCDMRKSFIFLYNWVCELDRLYPTCCSRSGIGGGGGGGGGSSSGVKHYCNAVDDGHDDEAVVLHPMDVFVLLMQSKFRLNSWKDVARHGSRLSAISDDFVCSNLPKCFHDKWDVYEMAWSEVFLV